MRTRRLKVPPDGSVDTFDYDANGNFISSTTGKTVTWTSYNYPRRTAEGTNAVDFFYGPDRQRYKEEIYSGGTLQSRRITVNGYFERVTVRIWGHPHLGSGLTFKHA